MTQQPAVDRASNMNTFVPEDSYQLDSYRPGTTDKQKTSKKIIAALFLVVFALLVVLAVVLICVTSRSSDDKQNCQNDGFEKTSYNLTKPDGTKIKKFVKFLFVEDIDNDEYYNFGQAKNACIELGANLWEIADGHAEWDAIIKIAIKMDKSSMWLNADTNSSNCPDMKNVCKESEAIHGRGIPVNWPSFPNSNYSRLYNSVTPEKTCVYVDNQKQGQLWKTGSCTSITAWAPCIKRDCEEEVVWFFYMPSTNTGTSVRLPGKSESRIPRNLIKILAKLDI